MANYFALTLHYFAAAAAAQYEHFPLKIHSHGVAAATVPLSIGFQPHSVRQWQQQSNIQCNAKYFAAAVATQNGVGTYLLAALLLQPLPQVFV